MRIAIVAPPFIPVPPPAYGGTELFLAQLATGLTRLGHDVVLYANGESSVPCEVRWTYAAAEWPIAEAGAAALKQLVHTAWAMQDVVRDRFDAVHVNDATAVALSPFVGTPVVTTLHHPHDEALADVYRRHPHCTYVAISDFQRAQERMPRMLTIHHGLRIEDYRFEARKQDYLAFIGRIAPQKGTHVAIAVARRAGLPLRIAGEIQPVFRDYWEQEVAPHVDGTAVEFLGEADFAAKNALLAGARALLFPIQWHEPFGLAMIEAMACGTPVLAFAGGSVAEVVRDGINGFVCSDEADMAARAATLAIDPVACREDVGRRFHVDLMVSRYEQLLLGLGAGAQADGAPPDEVALDRERLLRLQRGA